MLRVARPRLPCQPGDWQFRRTAVCANTTELDAALEKSRLGPLRQLTWKRLAPYPTRVSRIEGAPHSNGDGKPR